MGEKTHLEMKQETVDFYKMAYCVDGDAELVHRTMKSDIWVKLTDSKRGVFYVTSVKESEAENDQ
jgi:hypothetical protein